MGLTTWTEERIAKLRELWDTPMPASKIGEQMGITRCAVLGKAHRENLSARPAGNSRRSDAEPKQPKGPRNSFRRSQQWAAPKDNQDTSKRNYLTRMQFADVAPQTKGLTLLELEPHHCRYATNHESPYLFCGHPIVDKSFCEHHLRVCYVPARSR